MFRLFHNHLQKHRRACGKIPGRLSSRSGQIAIILIFVIAIGLIYYAIAFNLGEISESKTTATIAANTAAGMMGSLMASYGEQLFQETLGGSRKVCKGTSVIGAIIGVILALLIVIFAPYLAPLIGVAVGLFTAVAIIGLVFALTALALNVMVIQPGITKMWNEMMSAIKTPRHQFVERGIQAGIVAAVNDPVQVPDLIDFDTDGVFETDPESTSAADLVSRFAIYYTERLRDIEAPDSEPIEDFFAGVEDLLYGGDDRLVDPVDCEVTPQHICCASYQTRPSICNPCCHPSPAERPGDCPGNPESYCPANSPYVGGAWDYGWIYRGPIIQNELNSIQSIVERIGEDDPHPVYNRRPGTNWNVQQDWQPPGIPGNYWFDPDAPTLPRIQDTSGFYYPDDQRVTGIFPIFYKLRDWGTSLYDPPLDYQDEECHWCDDSWGLPQCPNPVELPELNLPNNPANSPQSFAGTHCVDFENTTSGADGPQLLDLVPLPEIFLDDTECALIGSLVDPGKGWKSGSDRYCSPAEPYASGCEKHGGPVPQCEEPGPDGPIPVDCDCGDPQAGPPKLWRDDDLDAIVWQMEEAAAFFQFFLDQNVKDLAWMFEDWYASVAEWIEPGCDCALEPGGCEPEECPSYTLEYRGGNRQGGTMWQWLDILQAYVNKIDDWLEGPYIGNGCRSGDGTTEDPAAWCVPPRSGGECPGVTAEEAATFGVGPDRGNLDSVIACMDWNANDSLQYTVQGGGQDTAVGNADKFLACIQQCAWYEAGDPDVDPEESCGNLPRALLGDLPAFDPSLCANNGYITDLANNFLAAQNQVEKLRKRMAFLQNRKTELEGMRGMMQTTLDRLAMFICGEPNGSDPSWHCGAGQGEFDLDAPNSPVENLINARINWEDVVPKTESVVIYVWQGERLEKPRKRGPGLDEYEGYWHAVKVEVRLPERCNWACGGGNQAGGAEPGFPTIKTYSKGFLNSKRCYELINTTGRVKVRVLRYDEDHDPSSMAFPGGQKIWDIYKSHPDAPGITGSQPGPGDLIRDSVCARFVMPQFRDIPYIENAFMLNEVPRNGPNGEPPPEPLATCWNLVHENMLEYGHSTESCVEFFFSEQGGFGGKGMRMKFVPCDEAFLRGDN